MLLPTLAPAHNGLKLLEGEHENLRSVEMTAFMNRELSTASQESWQNRSSSTYGLLESTSTDIQKNIALCMVEN